MQIFISDERKTWKTEEKLFLSVQHASRECRGFARFHIHSTEMNRRLEMIRQDRFDQILRSEKRRTVDSNDFVSSSSHPIAHRNATGGNDHVALFERFAKSFDHRRFASKAKILPVEQTEQLAHSSLAVPPSMIVAMFDVFKALINMILLLSRIFPLADDGVSTGTN